MKKKDQILLEQAYEQTLLKEGMLNSGIKTVLQPLFNSLFKKIKEKSPDTFAKLTRVNTPQELIDLINSHTPSSKSPQQQSEGLQDIMGRVRQAVTALVDKLELAGTGGTVFAGLGAIMSLLEQASSGSPNYGMMIAGLFMVAIKFAADGGMALQRKLEPNLSNQI
jgi:hypothetical protein